MALLVVVCSLQDWATPLAEQAFGGAPDMWLWSLTNVINSAAKFAQRQETSMGSSQMTLTQRPVGVKSKHDLERERALAPEPLHTNRAKPAGLPASYTIAPRSTYDGTRGADHRPIGAGGMEAFRKMTQKGKEKRA